MKWKRAYGYKDLGATVTTVSVSQLRHNLGLLPYWNDDDVRDSNSIAKAMKLEVSFSPLEVYKVRGKKKVFYVSDGNHRLYALRRLKILRIPVILFK